MGNGLIVIFCIHPYLNLADIILLFGIVFLLEKKLLFVRSYIPFNPLPHNPDF